MFTQILNYLSPVENFKLFGESLSRIALFILLFLFGFTILNRIKILTAKLISKKLNVDDGHNLAKSVSNLTLLTVSLYFSSHLLNLSVKTNDLIFKILTIVLFIQVGRLVELYFIPRAIRWLENSSTIPKSAHTFFIFLAKTFNWILIALLVLDNLGINITSLIAGLGIGGVAVALAVQNILGDLFCSLSILLDKPFEVGDFIVLGELKGEVEKIGIKSTRIRSLSGEQIIISNSDLTQGKIQNFKRMNQRRILFRFGVTYQTEVEKLRKIPEIVKSLIEEFNNTKFDRAHFIELGESALNYEVVFFVLSSEFNVYADIHHEINLKLIERFKTEGIDFAYPTRTISNAGNSLVSSGHNA